MSLDREFFKVVETMGIEARAGFISDVSTRWNSTYLILFRAIIYKEAFHSFVEVGVTYQGQKGFVNSCLHLHK